MATTRRKPRPQPAPLSPATLAQFIGDQQPDTPLLEQALELAITAAEAATGTTVGEAPPHPIRQGILLLASHLLITDRLESPINRIDIPLVVRALWRANAGHQPE
jgi:hypothetical protein